MKAAQRVLVKVGGAALQDESSLKNIAQALRQLQSAGHSLIVVHGGGPAINLELAKSGLTWNFIDGQRVTTPEMMVFIEKALSGTVNRQLTQVLQNAGVQAVGLSAADGLLFCERFNAQLGQVGRVHHVNVAVVEAMLLASPKSVPVIAPVGGGFQGARLNVNADWAAVHLALGFNVQRLLFLTDQEGILDANGQALTTLESQDLESLIADNTVSGGMLTKTRAILYALEHGLPAVQVLKIQPDSTDGGLGPHSGTVCTLTRPRFQSAAKPIFDSAGGLL